MKLFLILTTFLYGKENNNNSLNLENSLIKNITGSTAFLAIETKRNSSKRAYIHNISELYVVSKDMNNFNFDVGVIKYNNIDELNENDNPTYTKPMFHQMALEYKDSMTTLKIGRQILVMDWLGSYRESIFFNMKVNENIDFTFIHTRAYAWIRGKVGFDFSNYNKLNGGLNIASLKYKISDFTIKPYVYFANKIYKFYGIKFLHNSDFVDSILHYVISDEYEKKEDAYVFHGEVSFKKFEKFIFKLGYIQTAKKIGSGSIGSIDSYLKPTDESRHILKANAKSKYFSISYMGVPKLKINTSYLKTDFTKRSFINELSISSEYELNKKISFGCSFTDVSFKNGKDDYITNFVWTSYKF